MADIVITSHLRADRSFMFPIDKEGARLHAYTAATGNVGVTIKPGPNVIDEDQWKRATGAGIAKRIIDELVAKRAIVIGSKV